MVTYTNIKLKVSRLEAMKSFKRQLGIGLGLAKKMVDDINGLETLTAKGRTWNCNFDLYPEYSGSDMEVLLHINFTYEMVDDSPTDSYDYYQERKPCPATVAALAWLETQTDEVKEMVKLIGDWENPAVVAGGYA